LLNPAALPLTTRDHFKVSVQVDPPAYLYVFWIEPDREATPLYPWAGARWDSRRGRRESSGGSTFTSAGNRS
jgi:hypothetical protein